MEQVETKCQPPGKVMNYGPAQDWCLMAGRNLAVVPHLTENKGFVQGVVLGEKSLWCHVAEGDVLFF